MTLVFKQTTILLAAVFIFGVSAHADMVSVTFVGASTGVNDGADYVLPYQLTIDGTVTNVTCYDVFDNVSDGQSWTANDLTLNQAAATGQFSGNTNALALYAEIGFLSQQTTSSPQDQIDLQHDIWNVFAPGRYYVTAGMQAYLDLLTTPAYTDFDFSQVRFLEDVNQTSPTQAFVFDPPSAVPEPGTVAMMCAGALLIGIGTIRKRLK